MGKSGRKKGKGNALGFTPLLPAGKVKEEVECYYRTGEFPLPGANLDVQDAATAEKLAKEKAAKLKRQEEAVADLGRKLESLNFPKALGGSFSMTQENSVW